MWNRWERGKFNSISKVWNSRQFFLKATAAKVMTREVSVLMQTPIEWAQNHSRNIINLNESWTQNDVINCLYKRAQNDWKQWLKRLWRTRKSSNYKHKLSRVVSCSMQLRYPYNCNIENIRKHFNDLRRFFGKKKQKLNSLNEDLYGKINSRALY